MIKYGKTSSRPEGLCVLGKANTEKTILDFMELYETLVKQPLPAPFVSFE